MSNTIRWDIKPKEIDVDDNESNLDSYTITGTYTGDLEQSEVITAGNELVARYLETCQAYELISDQPVTLTINSTVFTGVKNVLVNLSTALTVTTVTIDNAGAVSATIIWRMWGNSTLTS